MSTNSIEQFDQWTLSLGNGEVNKVKIPPVNVATRVSPNSKENRDAEGQAMKEFIGKIFPELRINIQDRNWLEGRAILCATNAEVNMVNEMVSTMLPGDRVTYSSADELQVSGVHGNPSYSGKTYATVNIIQEDQSIQND